MKQPNAVRVLLVDDHAVVRSGLGAVLNAFEGLELVGEAGDGKEAIEMCGRLHPDVILMDLVMPVMDGAEATKVIRQKWPNVRVIALTSFKERDLVEGVLKAGAIGYLLKNISANELVTAIKNAVAGKPSLSPEAAQVLIQHVAEPKTIGHDLTKRERDVLALIVDGCGNIAIAERLMVSRSTVKFHVSNILSKLGCDSRTEAVAVALKNRLIR